MKLITTLQTIQRIDQLVRLKATGTPTQLAKRIKLSERSIYNIVDTMKIMGAPIYYNKSRRSYCYEKDVQFKFGFYCQDNEVKNLTGGTEYNTYLFSSLSENLHNNRHVSFLNISKTFLNFTIKFDKIFTK